MYYIYYIPAFDGSMYVGQTKNLQQRQGQHRYDLYKSNEPKYLYFRKLGMNKKDIKLYVLKYCDKENVNELELKFIRMFGKLNKVRNDFNLKEYQKEWREKNSQKLNEYKKKYKKNYYIKNKQKKKEYYIKNKEKINEYKKEWREKNRQKLKEHQKKYREKNKEKLKEYRKQKVKCDICDKEMRRDSLNRHKKTKH